MLPNPTAKDRCHLVRSIQQVQFQETGPTLTLPESFVSLVTTGSLYTRPVAQARIEFGVAGRMFALNRSRTSSNIFIDIDDGQICNQFLVPH